MRQEPELSECYRKDPREEQFLHRLNEILAPCQQEDYRDLPEKYPTLHIIGAPRSGTTLLSQLIVANLDVGYINNLVAVFWRAPVFGIRLSRKLLGNGRESLYQSNFGRTKGLLEPHEFGYFWSTLLNHENMDEPDEQHSNSIDWLYVRRVLTNMTNAISSPLVFKSFLVAWHIRRMVKILPRTLFVRIRRDPVTNALSMLNARKQYLNSMDQWLSLRPEACERLTHEPPIVQVAGQLYHIEQAMTHQLEEIPPANVLELRYEQVCGSPSQAVSSVEDLLSRNGAAVDRIGSPPKRFEPGPRKELPDSAVREAAAAVDLFFGHSSRAA